MARPQICELCSEFAMSQLVEEKEFDLHSFPSALNKSAQGGCELCRIVRQACYYGIDHFRRLLDSNGSVPLKLEYSSIDDECIISIGAESETGLSLKTAGEAFAKAFKPESVCTFSLGNREQDLGHLIERVILPWLGGCQDSPNCPPQLPTRVIDVGLKGSQPSLRVRKVDFPRDGRGSSTDEDAGDYLILSYCWGSSNGPARTIRSNLAQRMQGIDVNSLPRTIRDAIRLTRLIGIRYLWVDALCIVQPEPGYNDDWVKEAPRMRHYYGNAFCTIAATGARDSDDGLFFERLAHSYPVKPFPLAPSTSSATPELRYIVPATIPSWDQCVDGAPLYDRGWTMQERFLSSRILHWTRDSLCWESPSSSGYEYDLESDPESSGALRLNQFDYPDKLGESIHQRLGPHIIKADRQTTLGLHWTRLLQWYSRCQFTHSSDRLIALSGMAERSNESQPDLYVAGMWRESLVEGLTWYTDATQKITNPGLDTTIAPSWSWAAVNSRLNFASLDPFGFKPTAHVLWVETYGPEGAVAEEATQPTVMSQATRSGRSSTTFAGRNHYGSLSGGILRMLGALSDISVPFGAQTFTTPNGLCYNFHPKGKYQLILNSLMYTLALDRPLPEGVPTSAKVFPCFKLGISTSRIGFVYFLVLEKVPHGGTEQATHRFRRIGMLHMTVGGSGYEEALEYGVEREIELV